VSRVRNQRIIGRSSARDERARGSRSICVRRRSFERGARATQRRRRRHAYRGQARDTTSPLGGRLPAEQIRAAAHYVSNSLFEQ